RATASTSLLGQCRRVPSQPLAAHVDRVVGLEAIPPAIVRPQRQSVGQADPPTFPRRSPQRLTPPVSPERISRPSTPQPPHAEIPKSLPPPAEVGRLVSRLFRKVQKRPTPCNNSPRIFRSPQ